MAFFEGAVLNSHLIPEPLIQFLGSTIIFISDENSTPMNTKQRSAPCFQWQGKNAQGQTITGTLHSTHPAMVKAILRRRGITPLKVHKTRRSLYSSRQKITSKDITLFARQMATLLAAGVSIIQAFDITADSATNTAMKNLTLTLKKEVTGGATFYAALRQHPTHFSNLFCHLIHAGEQGGVLEELLEKVAAYQEKTESLKAKVQKALYYPLAVMIVAAVITTLIMLFVVPQFQSLFSGFGADLPIFTQLIIHLSDFILGYWWILCLIGILGSLFCTLLWRHSPTVRNRVEQALFVLPIIGKIRHTATLARFCRTTAILSSAGMPLVEALSTVAGVVGRITYHQAVLGVRDQIATGQSLQYALQHQTLFPPMLLQMVAIGEESGTLDNMLNKAADFYEEAVDNTVNGLSSLLEPMIMVFLGVIIGGLVVALYLPIFQLGSVVTST